MMFTHAIVMPSGEVERFTTGPLNIDGYEAVQLAEPVVGWANNRHLVPFFGADGAVVWTDPRTTEDHRDAKWSEIKQARNAAEFGQFVWDGSVFDGDATSQQRIQGLSQIARLDPSMSVDWTLADNTVRCLTAGDAEALGLALAAHVNAQHVKARALRALIDDATTPGEVQAITWES